VDINLDGPVSGMIDSAYTFTATVEPVSTTLPITLTWTASDQMDVTVVLTDTLMDAAAFAWDTPGEKVIVVTAENSAGTAVVTHTITITEVEPVVAPVAITLVGPSDGEVGMTYSFTATVQPVSTTLPVTLTWSVTDQADVTVVLTDSLTFTGSFTWDTAGEKVILVTAVNAAGTASASQTFTVAEPMHMLYLPIIFNND